MGYHAPGRRKVVGPDLLIKRGFPLAGSIRGWQRGQKQKKDSRGFLALWTKGTHARD